MLTDPSHLLVLHRVGNGFCEDVYYHLPRDQSEVTFLEDRSDLCFLSDLKNLP